jgi:acyl-CoA hydrolase
LNSVGGFRYIATATLKVQSMSKPYTAIQIVMMPRDTNPHGTIFGGVA